MDRWHAKSCGNRLSIYIYIHGYMKIGHSKVLLDISQTDAALIDRIQVRIFEYPRK